MIMKKGLKILLLADMWATLAIGMIGPIYAIFVEEIGGDVLDASWAYFAFMITSGVIMYLISHWEDRVKHKEKLVIIGYSLSAIGFLSYYFVNSQMSLIITQIILGLSEAILIPAYDAMYSGYLDKNKEASEWGDWESMRYIVTAISAIIGGYIVHAYNFKVLFLVMFGTSIFSIITSVWLFKTKKYLNT